MKKILLIIAIIFCIFQLFVLATVIDIGTPAISRLSNLPPDYTYINRGNPANATGVITSVEMWALNITLENCEVATFYLVNGTNFTTRDTEFIGTVPEGSHQQFDVNLNVVTGDYLGVFFDAGAISSDDEGGVAYWYKSGDNIPCADVTFTLTGNTTRIISLYGTGATIEPPPQVTNVQATDGTHIDKVVVTWDAASGADKYYVWQGSDWIDVGDVTTWDDTEAPAPTITHGSCTASDGSSTAHVALNNAGATANNGSSISYKVKAWNAAGYGPESATNSGYRGVGDLNYQWWRSPEVGDYVSIPGATASTYNDTAAPEGSVPGNPTGVSATDEEFTDKVVVTWTNVSGAEGALMYYKCYHTATGAAPGFSPFNGGYRKAYTSTNTQVKRDAVELGAIGSLQTSYNDTGADAPTITVGTASASDGTSPDHVTLSIAGESANVGTVHAYYARTYNAAGWSDWAGYDNGNRDVGVLTYLWERSSGDADADYSVIDGATTDPYNDTGAPEDGSGRYFKCVENATGAAEQTTNANRGYRIPAGITWNNITITKWNNITITIPLNTQ